MSEISEFDPNHVRFEFLKTEIDISHTFAETALDPHSDSEKRTRNLENARKGYDTLLKLWPKTPLTQEEGNVISKGVASLRMLLLRLGESV